MAIAAPRRPSTFLKLPSTSARAFASVKLPFAGESRSGAAGCGHDQRCFAGNGPGCRRTVEIKRGFDDCGSIAHALPRIHAAPASVILPQATALIGVRTVFS